MCIPSVGDRGVARTAVVLVVLALAGSIVLAALVGAPGLIGVPGVLLAVERLVMGIRDGPVGDDEESKDPPGTVVDGDE